MKSILRSQGALEESEKVKGVVFVPFAATPRFGYAEVPFRMLTFGVTVLSVALIAVALAIPEFVNGTFIDPDSPGSRMPFPFPLASVSVNVPGSKLAEAEVVNDCVASSAMMMPAPASRSAPAVSISMAVLVNAVLTCAAVSDGLADSTNAAMALAWGAAAEVPEKVVPKPPTPVTDTLSAAVISGF